MPCEARFLRGLPSKVTVPDTLTACRGHDTFLFLQSNDPPAPMHRPAVPIGLPSDGRALGALLISVPVPQDVASPLRFIEPVRTRGIDIPVVQRGGSVVAVTACYGPLGWSLAEAVSPAHLARVVSRHPSHAVAASGRHVRGFALASIQLSP